MGESGCFKNFPGITCLMGLDKGRSLGSTMLTRLMGLDADSSFGCGPVFDGALVGKREAVSVFLRMLGNGDWLEICFRFWRMLGNGDWSETCFRKM